MVGDTGPTALRYGPDYAEELTLGDGTRVRLRLVRKEDKPQFERGLMRLSPQSQYLRFFTAKSRFTESELAYLTELDGWNHLAIGAVELDASGEEGEGIGVARFVRLRAEPQVAEPAVAVIDARQGQGIGRTLMQRLGEAARERGIETFRSEFLAINTSMKELVRELSPAARFTMEGPVVTAEFSLVPPAGAAPGAAEAADAGAPMGEWLGLVARRLLELRRQFQMWLDPERLHEAWLRFQGREGGDSTD